MCPVCPVRNPALTGAPGGNCRLDLLLELVHGTDLYGARGTGIFLLPPVDKFRKFQISLTR